jgi:hypothetical protein
MSATEVHNASRDPAAGNVDMHLEVGIIPVADVEGVPTVTVAGIAM